MGIITAADLTWNGKEVMALSEAIMEKVYAKHSLSAFHDIVPGIVAKQQIAILGRLGLVGKKSSAANCEPATSTEKVVNTEKFWLPEFIDDRFEHCWKELKETFFQWGLKKGLAKYDLDGTDFMNFLSDVISDALEEAIWRIVYFSKTDIADVDASPPGKLTSGTDILYFNAIDGFFEQMFDIVSGDATKRETIDKNAGVSYLLQKFDTADTTAQTVTHILDDMMTNADERLTDNPNVVYIATKSVVDQYKRELRFQNLDASFVKIEGGFKGIEYDGTIVISNSIWDRIIRSYFDNGTTTDLPHRIILTTTDALKIGVEEEANLSEMTIVYDPRTKSILTDIGYNIDAKMVEDYLFHFAY